MNKEKSKLQRTPSKNDQGKRKSSPTKNESESKRCRLTPKKDGSVKSVRKEASVFPRGLDSKEQVAEQTAGDGRARQVADGSGEDQVAGLLWVDKYKPASLKAVIGQQGDQSCANKLLRWLQNWHKSPSEDQRHGDSTASFERVCVRVCVYVCVCVCHPAAAQWHVCEEVGKLARPCLSRHSSRAGSEPRCCARPQGAVVNKTQALEWSSQAVGET